MTLPGYLNNSPVVTGRQGNTLVVSADTESAERLSDGVARVLRDALSDRLGVSRVLIAGDGRIPDADLTIEFLALDPYPKVLRLDARWTLTCTAPNRTGHAGRTRLEVALTSATASAVAAPTADALGRLADILALEIQCT